MRPAVTHFSASLTLYLCSVESLAFMIENEDDSCNNNKKKKPNKNPIAKEEEEEEITENV